MLIYLLIINALGFAIMLWDKYLAKNNLRRIPERSLFGIAVFGGSLGCIIGMYTVRHKTRHKSFTLGMPAILIVQIVFLYFVLKQ